MSKAFVVGFVMGLVLLAVGGVGASRRHQKDVEQEKDRAELKEYQAELRDATAVRFGVLTDNQRIHSRLFAKYLQLGSNRTISGLVAAAEGKGKIVSSVVFVGNAELLTESETPENYFHQLANASDAVIRGRVTKRVSQITEDDGFVLTDYDVLAAEVFKNNATQPIETGAMITVTRPGGKVLLDGVIVKAIDEAFAPLPLNDHDVVLFLKFIPETGAYKATRPTGSFELDGTIIRPLTGVAFPPGVLRNGDSFLKTVRAVSNQ